MSSGGISTGRRRGTAAILIAALALLLLPALASAAGNGAISGTVTRAAGGAPVEGAVVCAETEGEVFAFECAQTAADGTYEITELPPADYFVFFQSGESGEWLVGQYYDGVRRWEEAAPVTVSTGATTPGIDAALVEGGAIAGKVTDAASGAPIADVEVCSWLEGSELFDGCGFTASDGTYEIAGAAEGLHEVEFFSFEGGYEPKFVTGVSVSVGSRTSNVNAALGHAAPPLPPEGRITGHVYAAATHALLPGVSVCAIWAETGETGGCAITGPTGGYTFYPVAVGAWKVVFSPEPAEVEFRKNAKTDVWPTQF